MVISELWLTVTWKAAGFEHEPDLASARRSRSGPLLLIRCVCFIVQARDIAQLTAPSQLMNKPELEL